MAIDNFRGTAEEFGSVSWGDGADIVLVNVAHACWSLVVHVEAGAF